MKNINIIIILIITLIILYSLYNAFITEEYSSIKGNTPPENKTQKPLNSDICKKLDDNTKFNEYKREYEAIQPTTVKPLDAEKKYNSNLNLTDAEKTYNNKLKDLINNYISEIKNFIKYYNDNVKKLTLTNFINDYTKLLEDYKKSISYTRHLKYTTDYNILLENYLKNNNNVMPRKDYNNAIKELLIKVNIEVIKQIQNLKINQCFGFDLYKTLEFRDR